MFKTKKMVGMLERSHQYGSLPHKMMITNLKLNLKKRLDFSNKTNRSLDSHKIKKSLRNRLKPFRLQSPSKLLVLKQHRTHNHNLKAKIFSKWLRRLKIIWYQRLKSWPRESSRRGQLDRKKIKSC